MDKANKNFENISDYSKSMERVRNMIYTTFDFDELMSRLIVVASEAVNCDTAAISFRENDNWVVRYSYGFDADVIGTIMNDEEERHAVLAIQTRQS